MKHIIILVCCILACQAIRRVPVRNVAVQRTLAGSGQFATAALRPAAGCSEEDSHSTNNTGRPSMSNAGLLPGSRQLALDLFKTVSANSDAAIDNVFFSPVSIWLALVSAYFGARGETVVELARVLRVAKDNKAGVSAELNRIKLRFAETSTADSSPAGGNTLRLANRLYFSRDETLCPRIVDYLGATGSQNDLGVQQLGFATDPEASRRSINSWVEEQTENRITDLLQPGDIDLLSRLVLANAAYFKGQWAVQFDEKLTRPQKFYSEQQQSDASSQSVMVQMMQARDSFRYATSRPLNSRILELSFAGGDLSLIALLPTSRETSVESVVALLSPDILRRELEAMTPRTLSLSFPKFRIEQSLELTDVLTKLGLGSLFDRSRSDLSGFTGTGDLYVGKVRHKAFVEVNEQGAEAAAATAIVIQTYSAMSDDVLVFNRPFIFFIRDNKQDSILFAGIIRKP